MKNSNETKLIFQPERLKKLAAYLRNAKLSKRIEVLDDDDNLCHSDQDRINVFPVFTCILDALPIVFPNDWARDKSGEVYRKHVKNGCCITSIISYFGVEIDMFMHLFTPFAQSVDEYGGGILTRNSTGADFADNIVTLVGIDHMAMKLHPEIKIFISKN